MECEEIPVIEGDSNGALDVATCVVVDDILFVVMFEVFDAKARMFEGRDKEVGWNEVERR